MDREGPGLMLQIQGRATCKNILVAKEVGALGGELFCPGILALLLNGQARMGTSLSLGFLYGKKQNHDNSYSHRVDVGIKRFHLYDGFYTPDTD